MTHNFLVNLKWQDHYRELKSKLEELRNEERDVLLKIKNVERASGAGYEFAEMLKDLKQQTSVAAIETSEYICPLCGHDCQEHFKERL